MSASAELFSTALACHQAGELVAAEGLYRQILASHPQDAQAWHLLGVAATQQGRFAEAISCIQRAMECAVPHPLLHYNLARALHSSGDESAALVQYRRAVQLRSDFFEARLALGALAAQRQLLPEALEQLHAACDLDPEHAEAQFHLAAALQRAGRASEAEQRYARVLQLRGPDASTFNNLGTLAQQREDYARAAGCYERSLQLDPGRFEARVNLADALQRLGQDEQAVEQLEAALAQEPEHELTRQRLVKLLALRGETDRARGLCREVLRRQPDRWLWRMRAASLLPEVLQDGNAITAERRTLHARVAAAADGGGECPLAELTSSGVRPPLPLAYHGRDDRPLKETYANAYSRRLDVCDPPVNDGLPHVIFVVTGAGEGVFQRGMSGLLSRINPARLQVTLAIPHSVGGLARKRWVGGPVRCLELPEDVTAANETLRAARCDLAYYWEIGSDNLNYFLPLLRPARLQCTSWGWPVTSGMSNVNFFVTHELLDPSGSESFYTERLVRLAELPHWYDRPRALPDAADAVPSRLAGEHVYFCPQSARKLHPDFDVLAEEILRRDDRAVLWLLQSAQPIVTRLLQERLQRRLHDVWGRVHWLPRTTKAGHYARLRAADVVLDTPHYGAGANSYQDACACGKLIVTFPGAFHRGRYAAAMHAKLGLAEWTPHSAEQYVSLALRLAAESDVRQVTSQLVAERSEILWEHQPSVCAFEDWALAAIATTRPDA